VVWIGLAGDLSPLGQTFFAHVQETRQAASLPVGEIGQKFSPPALADGRRLKQSCDPLEDPVHAHVGVHDGIDFMMVSTGVHDQDLRAFVGLLDHVWQVMAIVLGQGGAEDDEVKSIAAESFLNGLAVLGFRYLMSGLRHFGSLGGENLFI
jgi:hypothetical protein